jgi:hypothetical protein
MITASNYGFKSGFKFAKIIFLDRQAQPSQITNRPVINLAQRFPSRASISCSSYFDGFKILKEKDYNDALRIIEKEMLLRLDDLVRNLENDVKFKYNFPLTDKEKTYYKNQIKSMLDFFKNNPVKKRNEYLYKDIIKTWDKIKDK